MKVFLNMALIYVIGLNTTNAIEYVHGQHNIFSEGYFRASTGISNGGKDLVEFRAPGAQSNYRLGNEPDITTEIGLGYQFRFNDNHSTTNPMFFDLYYMADGYTEEGSHDDHNIENTAQAFVRAGNVFNRSIDIWYGRRYYHRKDININDHWWLNPGQNSDVGFGIEGMKIGDAIIRLAGFRYKDNVESLLDSENTGNLNARLYDLRIEQIKTNPNGNINLFFQHASREAIQDLGYEKRNGYTIGAWHTQENPFGLTGYQRAIVSYREGATMVKGTTTPNPVSETFLTGYDLDRSSVFEINNDWLIEHARQFAMQWSLIYRIEDRGFRPESGSSDKIEWASFGARPIWFFNKHWNMAYEIGLDYVDHGPLDISGHLFKNTLALQWTTDYGFYNRPVVRFFITHGEWSNEFKGRIGTRPDDPTYSDETNGWTAGLHFEYWW